MRGDGMAKDNLIILDHEEFSGWYNCGIGRGRDQV
jgi:hypothetical protein